MDVNVKLSKRELEIMRILWEFEPLTASEIEKKSGISISTVHTAINQLLKKNMIIVDEIVYSGTVLSRSYKSTINSQKFESHRILDTLKNLRNEGISASHLVASFLKEECPDDSFLSELDALEKLIKDRKEEIKKKM